MCLRDMLKGAAGENAKQIVVITRHNIRTGIISLDFQH